MEALRPQLENSTIRGNKTTKKHSRCSNATKALSPPVFDAFKKTSNGQPSDDMIFQLFEEYEEGPTRCYLVCNSRECTPSLVWYESEEELVEHVKKNHPLELQHRFNKWQTEG